jgi:hypothetical protein
MRTDHGITHDHPVFLDVSNAAGAALWLLDYSLYATQVGISRLHLHEGIGYKYNLVGDLFDLNAAQ